MKRTPIKRRYTEEVVSKLADDLLRWVDTADSLWLGEFAKNNKMSRARLHELACDNEKFNSAYEIAKQAQENWLVTGALSKKLETAMAIFSLKNVAGWRDKTEHDHNINVNVVDRMNRARDVVHARMSSN